MKIENFKIFLAVAEFENVHKAADELFLSHQNISFIIKNMEKELGLQLFHRSRKGMHLTEEGQAFLKIAQNIISSYDNFLNTYVNKDNIKVINIYTTSTMAGYISDLYEFDVLKKHIFSITTKYGIEEILKMISDNHQGIYLFPIVDGDPKMDAISYNKMVLLQDKIVTIVHKDSVYAKYGFITEKDLNKIPIIAGNSCVDKRGGRPIINIDNIVACKKIMKENHYCYRDTFWAYNKFFAQDNEWIILEGDNHDIEYIAIEVLPEDIKKLVEKTLIPKLQNIFAL